MLWEKKKKTEEGRDGGTLERELYRGDICLKIKGEQVENPRAGDTWVFVQWQGGWSTVNRKSERDRCGRTAAGSCCGCSATEGCLASQHPWVSVPGSRQFKQEICDLKSRLSLNLLLFLATSDILHE